MIRALVGGCGVDQVFVSLGQRLVGGLHEFVGRMASFGGFVIQIPPGVLSRNLPLTNCAPVHACVRQKTVERWPR